MTPEQVVQFHEKLVYYHVNRYARLIPSWELEDLAQEARIGLWEMAVKRPGDDLKGGGASRAITFRLGRLRGKETQRSVEGRKARDTVSIEALTVDVDIDRSQLLDLSEWETYPSESFDFDTMLGTKLSVKEQRICAGLARGDQVKEVLSDMGLTRRQGERILRNLRTRIRKENSNDRLAQRSS